METDEFDFKCIEKKWQKNWESSKIFQVQENKKKKFYVLEMFPYPSGSGLHMGHAFNYIISDIYARFKRMHGFNVLYPVGYDSLGLPAENAAIKEKVHPKKYTEKAISNFIKQQKSLGLSYDWSRLIMSHNSDYYKWDQWLFIQMFKKGLAYRKSSAVNFCPKCNSVLANEQVHNGKCWRHEDTDIEIKYLEQWFFKITNYASELHDCIDKLNWPEDIKIMQKNWIGKSYGININFKINGKDWQIFTTRPDTIFGVTFMVVSSQHPKLMELVTEKQKPEVLSFLKKMKSTSEKEQEEKEGTFTGSYAVNPLTNEKIPVYAGNFVLADYGSGMVMAVPCHDIRDFEFAKKYRIPIVRVIAKNAPVKSYLMGASNITDDDLKKLEIKIIEKTKEGDRKIEIPEKNIKHYENLIIEKLTPGFWNEYIGNEIVFIFKHKNNQIERIILNKETEERIDKLSAEFNGENWKNSNVWKWLAENKFYTESIVHTEEGILVNSSQFNGLKSREAIQKISEYIEKHKLGKKATNYKLKDWLISRQRYWGTPIPVIYCSKCGIVPVNEKELPIKLPEKVVFGKGNPLETNNEFVNVKCPKCRGNAKRETDTMDTFVNSSWYFLRYCDPKNNKEIFGKKKVNYWMPIDLYIGGKEHACMHLIYFRFYTKFLRDLGLLNFDEPALKLFNQGMLHGSDNHVMSKSRGNVILPEEISNKYGIDTARLFLVSIASPDKDILWSEAGIEGSFKFIKKVISYFESVKIKKSSEKTESKYNKTIKEVTDDIENLRYNLTIIKIRELFDSFSENESKHILEGFLKMLSPFCPHITEELWHNLKNKTFISLEKWPVADESKINEKFEQNEKIIEKLIEDINNIAKIMIQKSKKPSKVFIYVLPKEKDIYFESKNLIEQKTNLIADIFAVNDSKKYDPEKKSKKAKPGKPAIYIE